MKDKQTVDKKAMTTQENKLLAVFMGTSLFDGELLPVWYKFRLLAISEEYEDRYSDHRELIVEAFRSGTFADLYNALVNAVQWYNSIKKEA